VLPGPPGGQAAVPGGAREAVETPRRRRRPAGGEATQPERGDRRRREAHPRRPRPLPGPGNHQGRPPPLLRVHPRLHPPPLPHLRDRPTALVRCPEGVSGECFYQKHVGTWAPPSVRRVKIKEKTKVGEYLVADDLPALVGLVQIGILEIHTWNSTAAELERP